jgi:hypothetical protein
MPACVQMIDQQVQEPRRISRRFTTLEGWYEVREGVYALGQKTLTLNFAHQFDLEQCNDDRTSFVASDKVETRHFTQHTSLRHEDTFCESQKFSETRDAIALEKPYHVYSSKQKWAVVVLIGVAGLFSGLSSNIYFPSLDAIANVSEVLAQ